MVDAEDAVVVVLPDLVEEAQESSAFKTKTGKKTHTETFMEVSRGRAGVPNSYESRRDPNVGHKALPSGSREGQDGGGGGREGGREEKGSRTSTSAEVPNLWVTESLRVGHRGAEGRPHSGLCIYLGMPLPTKYR